MKNRASGLLKQIISVIKEMARSKSMALKSKTRALKTRLIIFSLLRNKKMLMSSFSDKLRSLLHPRDFDSVKIAATADGEDQQQEETEYEEEEESRAVVLHNDCMSFPNPTHTIENEEEENDDDDDKYPDLTHSLFDLDAGGSVIEMVKNSKPEGQEFRLEDEIDQVADLFIKRFHRQMMIQKQLSLNRQMEEEMLASSTQ